MAELLSIPITKAGGRVIEVNTDDLPNEIYQAALIEGLKTLANAGITSTKYPTKGLEGEELAKTQDAIYAKAVENIDALKRGELKKGRTKSASSKVPAAVMVEARRLAKEVVKNEIRAAGMKISHVPASDITKAANALIEADPSFVKQAEANIAERSQVKSLINIKELVHESPALVKAAENRKTLSATQAGKVAKRKPAAQPDA